MFIIEKSFVIVIAAVLIGALFIWWEIRLSKAEAFWKGLIPLGAAALVIGGASFLTLTMAADQKVELLHADLDNGMQVEMAVKTLNGEIIAYGPMEIYDREGVLRDRVSIMLADLKDKEMADVKLPRYQDVFTELTAGKTLLATVDSDKDDILDESRLIFPDDGTQVSITYSTMWMCLAYLCVPMLAIYWMKRRQLKKERLKRELRKMNIENLG